jgi:tetratricopeptide (TPR) repeat protein
MDPSFTGAYLWLARGYELESKWSDAIDAYRRAMPSYGPQYFGGVAIIYAASGNRPQAKAAFAKLNEFSRDNYVSPLVFAQYFAALGDRHTALEWLDRAYRERAVGRVTLEVNHWFDQFAFRPAIPGIGAARRILTAQMIVRLNSWENNVAALEIS